MSAKAIRSITINMRTTTQEKSFLQKAAELAGFSNLTNFMMTAARKEAVRILSDMNTTYLSAQDWELINRLLSSQPEPNERLKQLLGHL